MERHMDERPRMLDVVRLTRDSDGWPAGSEGTIVEEYERGVLIEYVSENPDDHSDSLMDDLFSAPYDALEVIWRAPVRTR